MSLVYLIRHYLSIVNNNIELNKNHIFATNLNHEQRLPVQAIQGGVLIIIYLL